MNSAYAAGMGSPSSEVTVAANRASTPSTLAQLLRMVADQWTESGNSDWHCWGLSRPTGGPSASFEDSAHSEESSNGSCGTAYRPRCSCSVFDLVYCAAQN